MPIAIPIPGVNSLLAMLGLKPEAEAAGIITAIVGTISRIGDRKARCAAVEVSALTAAQYQGAVSRVLAGRADETAILVKDALLEANMQTFGLLAKTVDIDGSLDVAGDGKGGK